MNEELIYKGKVSNLDLIVNIALIFIVVGMFTIWGAIKRRNSFIEVYPHEVIAKQGITSKKTLSYPIKSIQSISVEQGLFGKLFNYGTVTISTAGSGYMKMEAMDNPEEIKRVIYNLK